jgi:hypothetical protein
MITGLLAGETIAAGDACYVKGADGKIWRSTGAAANAAAEVDGFAAENCVVGEALTLFRWVVLHYSTALMTPGTYYYVSGSAPGGLDTGASTGGLVPVARSVDSSRLFVFPSYPASASISSELLAIAAAVPTIAVADIAATTALTTVPGSFADLPAVQAYLAGANCMPNAQTRLINLEAKVNALLAQLRIAGIVTP